MSNSNLNKMEVINRMQEVFLFIYFFINDELALASIKPVPENSRVVCPKVASRGSECQRSAADNV